MSVPATGPPVAGGGSLSLPVTGDLGSAQVPEMHW